MSLEILTEEETESIIMSLALSRGDKGFDEGDAKVVVAWAKSAIMFYKIFEMVKNGLVAIDVKNGEAVFSKTPEGNNVFKNSLSEINVFVRKLSDNMKGD